MYALYSPEHVILDRVRGALPAAESGRATTRWSEFEVFAAQADCLLIALRWVSEDLRGPLRFVASGTPRVPVVLITTKDADNARTALNSGATRLLWLSEIQRELQSLLRGVRGNQVLHRAAIQLEGSACLSPQLRTALAHACRAERPIRSVGELAALVRRDRRTLWRHWQRATVAARSLRLEDFLDWILVLRALSLKTPYRSWAQVAHELGAHEHTLSRIAARLTRATLTKLGTLRPEDLEAGFLEMAVSPFGTSGGPHVSRS